MISQNNLHVAITGASGFVATNVRSHLQSKGVQLTSFARKNFKNHKNERKILLKKFDKKNLLPKMKNCSALVHLIGTGRQTAQRTFESVNVEITKNIVQACKQAKIKKIIYISGLGVHKDTSSAYFISKYNAEQEIIKSGLDYTILRASYIIGKTDPLTRNLTKQIKKGTIVIPGSGQYHMQPIFVNDVAEVIFRSLTNKKFSKKILDLVGPELITYKKFIQVFKNKSKVKIKNLNLEKAYFNALHNPKNSYGIDDLNIMIGDFTGDHKKLKKISGIKFKNFREVLDTRSLAQ